MVEKKNLPSLEELEADIKKAKGEEDVSDNGDANLLNPTRVSLELFSGVVVGTVMGYFLDKWLDTKPIFLIILFFFGVAAGALNIYKLVAKQTANEEKNKK